MDRQGTWEILLLPVGKDAGKGMASVNNSDPGPLSSLRGGGSAMSGTQTRQAPCGAGWRINKPKAMREQEVVAP